MSTAGVHTGPDHHIIDDKFAEATLSALAYQRSVELVSPGPRLGPRCRAVCVVEVTVARVAGDDVALNFDSGIDVLVDGECLHSMGAVFAVLFVVDIGPSAVMLAAVPPQEKEEVAVICAAFPAGNGSAVAPAAPTDMRPMIIE